MQVYPGVYQINGSPYGRHQNSYLVHREGGTILVDSGDLEDAYTLPEIEQNAARWGFRMEDATHLFITHPHFDHASHAAELQRRGIKLAASAQTAAAMEAGDERCIGYAVQKVFEPCQVDTILADGQKFDVGGLQVLSWAAPGHTAGVLVFEIILDGERLWFTGDLFEAQHAHRDVGFPYTGAPDFDPKLHIQSLKRLLELPRCEHIFPGHGPAKIGEAHRLVQMAYNNVMMDWR